MEMEIRALKIRKNAIIMAHNYQPLEIQALADVVGDSLELAVRAKEAKADLIVVCGVRFMAETAKILNPERKVVIPVPDAGCPLADFLTPEMIREAKERHPDAAVVVYVNSTAESKALADVTCTSANASRSSHRSKTIQSSSGRMQTLQHTSSGSSPKRRSSRCRPAATATFTRGSPLPTSKRHGGKAA